MKLLVLIALALLAWAYWTGRLPNFLGGTAKPQMNDGQARALLGVDRGSDRETILKAHKSMMAKHHPDVGGNAEIARQINEARDVLLARTTPKDMT